MPRSAAAQNEEALFEGTDFMDQLGQRVTEFKMPPIVEFAESPEYLNLGRLYPRQKTILRLMFLETDNMTAYDLEVIEAWSKGFDQGPDRMGISPDIWDRIKLLKAEGYDHFREILAVIGRRGSKGHLGAITLARQMFWLLNAGPPLNDQGDVKRGYPQEAYGLSENKELVALVTATNFLQARDNQFADLYFTIRFAPCFQKSLAVDLPHFIALRTEGDLERIRRLQLSGGNSGGKIIASVQAKAVTSNASAGRGVASFCLDPATPVLTSDLKWIPIEKLAVGDELVGIDENAIDGRQRKLRKSEVVNIFWSQQPALKLNFDDGSHVICSEDHRWLYRVNPQAGNNIWRKAGSLKAGDEIRHLVDPWEEDTSREAGYLAGFFDGEGCIVNTELSRSKPRNDILWSQNPGVVLDTVKALLSEKGFTPLLNRDPEISFCQQWALRGLPETMRFMGQIRPSRLAEIADRVWEGTSIRGGVTPNGRKMGIRYKKVISIEQLPEQSLVDIETTTHTFIANGFVSHNCQAYDEFAHMLNGANGPRTSEEVYEALTPALDQFGKDALIYIPTSPYAKTGKAWEIYEAGLELDEDNRPVNPEILVLQLPSWEPYRDFDDDRATDGRVFAIAPQKFGPILQRLERRNPQKFRIERRSQWAEVLDAYLPKEFVDWIFMAFCEDCGIPRSTEDQLVCHECGDTKPPRQLYPQTRGTMQHRYRAWVDSAKSVHNMCMAVAHTEAIEEGDGKVWHHVIVDVIKIWKPEDYDDHTLPIDDIMDDMLDICQRFPQLDAISFDQHGALLVPLMRRLLKKMGHHARVKDVSWGTHNTSKTRSVQQRWEDFKTALSMRWVHSFRDNAFYDNTSSLVEEELRYLQEVNGKVRKQDVGPVITDDAADAVSAVATELLADQLSRFMKREALAEARIAPGARGGYSSGYLDPEDAGSSQARAALRRAVGGMSQGGNVRRRDAASALIARDMGGRRRQGRDPTRGRNR